MKNTTNQFSRISTIKLFTLVVLFITASITATATATIDTTFGTNGRTTITLGDAQRVGGIAIQNNDKIIVAGDAFNSATQRDGVVVRYNPNGTLDQSFGSGGKVVLAITPRDDSFYAVAVQADGKIVVVGSVSPTQGSPNTDFLIARFNDNGTLDSSFGSNGIITINQGSFDSLRAVKIQPDGKIVAVGGTSDQEGLGAVIRLNQNGTFDTSFSGGVVFINNPNSSNPTFSYKNENFYSIDFYSNNRILLGGDLTSGTGPGSRGGMVTLLEPNGAVVQNFGSNGFLRTDINSYISQTIVRVLPNGNFVAGSYTLGVFTSEGNFIRPFVNRNVTKIASLSDGNFALLSLQGPYGNTNGIIIYNKNTQVVGSDEKSFQSEFSGTDLSVQSNDKIIILKDGVLLRLNGVTSNATRMANLDVDFYDRKTDIVVYRPSNRTVYTFSSFLNSGGAFQTDVIPAQFIFEKFNSVYNNSSIIYWHAASQTGAPGYFYRGNPSPFQWGVSGDVPVGGDYDGDDLTDFTVFRPSNGVWYIVQSSNNQFRAFQFGQAGDKLVPADYDYDGITDIAVFRPSNGTWYIRRSSDNGFRAVQFGTNGDVPAVGDYDGDGRADFVVYRPSNGTWYMLKSQEGFAAVPFGISTDQPVPGDYDGDGRHDAAVFRQGMWHLNQSRDGLRTIQWGLPGDIPVSVRY